MVDSSSQLALRLEPPCGWGGRRAGAGRKPGRRTRVAHERRGRISRHEPCHVTLRVRRDVPSLRNARLVRELERSFGAACDRGSFRLVHYSIQRDHVHLLVEADGAAPLARGMIALGARLARAVNRVFRRRGAVLAERFHHRVLRTPREARNALAYVLLNFRKHSPRTQGREHEFGVDPASTGRWFDGWTRTLPPSAERVPVTATRSWLLHIGWLRHGRIDPDGAPGGRR